MQPKPLSPEITKKILVERKRRKKLLEASRAKRELLKHFERETPSVTSPANPNTNWSRTKQQMKVIRPPKTPAVRIKKFGNTYWKSEGPV